MNEIRHYVTTDGRDLTSEWLSGLRDVKAKTAIIRRLNRMESGNFGDHEPCREGVWELRIDVGPGYRVYFARSGKAIILLLCGGDKRKQDADIKAACNYWKDWKKRGCTPAGGDK